ncbi:MAG: hypothetical protein IJM30_03275 [Thermoguttaceae bacterium]|nr:hypothetical protein [Thermoguttaceae bacterium]
MFRLFGARGIGLVSVALLFLVAELYAVEPVSVAYKSLDLNDDSALRLLEPTRVDPYQDGGKELDGQYVCDAGESADAQLGFARSYQIDQKLPTPLVATGWSKAENVGGEKDSGYSLYLDLIYYDDAPLWGQVYQFPVGDSDWTCGKVLIFPDKPVKSARFYAMFRGHSGKASFKDLELYQYDFDSQVAYFDGVPIEIPSRAPSAAPRVYLRDVANDGDYLELNVPETTVDDLGLTIERSKLDVNGIEELKLVATSSADTDRALALVCALPIPDPSEGDELVWFDDPRHYRTIERGEYSSTRSIPDVCAGRLSKYPFGVVATKDARGNWSSALGLGIDPDYPAFYRIAHCASTRELYIVFDFALTKEKPRAEFRVPILRWEIDSDGLSVKPSNTAVANNVPFGSDPFRAAFDLYRRAFSERFRVRAVEQGGWMAFAKISKVPNWQDFGFQFKEGIDELAEDDAKGITSFRYTEPMTWWQQVEKSETSPKTKEAAYAAAKELASDKDPKKWNVAEARALLTTGFEDKDGNPYGMALDTPWCDGVVWSMNDAPGLVELVKRGALSAPDGIASIAGYESKWSDKIADQLYGEPLDVAKLPKTREELIDAQKRPGCDGEYVDSSEGYVTATLDFKRAHFAGMETPLAYDAEEKKPAIFRGLIAFEYVRKMSDDCHARGKLIMANATPSLHFWLAPQLDVLGTETNWNWGGSWRPMPDDELMYRRTLCCGKPYCFIMNTDFSKFSRELTEKFMKRSLAYGIFPGFFSADASTGHYFETPELYERDRELFKKYMPIVKCVAEAGWEPETGADANDPTLIVERFGALDDAVVSSNLLRPTEDVYLTLFNDSDEEKEFSIALSEPLLRHVRDSNRDVVELLDDRDVSLTDGKIDGKIAPQDVKVFKIGKKN